MMRIKPPWWFCTGWWSPWCVLDHLTRCKVRRLCDRHDAAQIAEMNRQERDWLTDPNLSPAERLARFRSLNPEPTSGPSITITSAPTISGTFSTGTATNIRWTDV